LLSGRDRKGGKGNERVGKQKGQEERREKTTRLVAQCKKRANEAEPEGESTKGLWYSVGLFIYLRSWRRLGIHIHMVGSADCCCLMPLYFKQPLLGELLH
jgi:hypothetical protein